ncbi:MAG: 4-hydroxy-tetrahydrodipicolinate synthase [Candidatus Omnitrophota bacterium]|nr:4-hydroxy-tetrahydrodipicolinate synthase [Candidatus Omnitrophota bacterium]
MFKGSFTAIATPHKADGSIDEKKFRELIEFQIKNGINGIVPCGCTGEAATMSHSDQKRLIKISVETAAKRVMVIAGTGSNYTDEAIDLTKFAKKAGADASLSIMPYYNKPTPKGQYLHYEKIAGESDMPIMLYNVPSRTGISIQPETVARLSKIDNIIAIKEAGGSMDQVSRILSLCDITVLSGDDSLTLPMLLLGAKGVVSVAANIMPKEVAAMVEMALDGRYEEARKIHFKLLPVFKGLFIETNPIPVKTAMSLMNLIEANWRLPLCPMTGENETKWKKILKEADLI